MPFEIKISIIERAVWHGALSWWNEHNLSPMSDLVWIPCFKHFKNVFIKKLVYSLSWSNKCFVNDSPFGVLMRDRRLTALHLNLLKLRRPWTTIKVASLRTRTTRRPRTASYRNGWMSGPEFRIAYLCKLTLYVVGSHSPPFPPRLPPSFWKAKNTLKINTVQEDLRK